MTAAAQSETDGGGTALALRILGLCTVALGFIFIFNNWLIHWQGWPGLPKLFAHIGMFGLKLRGKPLDGAEIALALAQVALYVVPLVLIVLMVLRSRSRPLVQDAERLSALAAYIVRGAFWAVLFVGLADATISFLRVEGILADVVGEDLARDLGRSSFRGLAIHYPLILASFILALFTRTLGFPWLALLIVVAEMQIVVARFVFSYEQAFMADLVRFWYGSMFLFASSYTLLAEGHVRVDILYTGFSARAKAWSNLIGSVMLGVPLCWIILTRGMWGKTNMINGPMLNFEVTQSGFGMFVKYFMASFLIVYAFSMLIQFVSYALRNAAILLGQDLPETHAAETA